MDSRIRKKEINICFICDSGYVIPTIVALTSLKCCRDTDVLYKVFVILVKVNSESEQLFLKMTDKNFIVQIINVSSIEFDEYIKNNSGTIRSATSSALLKFKLPRLLKGIDKVLFLDGDILVYKDLYTMYETDIDDYLAAVIVDSGSLYFKHEFVKKVEHYFNSGVMLLNLKKMRDESVTELLFETKKYIQNDNLMDQNVFNIVFNKRIKFLSIKYNLLLANLIRAQDKYDFADINRCYGEQFSDLNQLKQEAYIIHYSSKDKPWKSDENVGFKEWYYFFSKSPVFEKRRLVLDKYQGYRPHYNIISNENNYKDSAPKVSVIIPVFNCKKFLRKALNSILLQTLMEIEIIIVDDGSDDGSLRILEEYQKIDTRIRLISLSTNCGQSVARNIGMDFAAGEYVYFFDSDDMLECIALESLYEACKYKNLDVIYFGGKSDYENEELKKTYPQYMTYYKKKNSYEDVMEGYNAYIEMVKNRDYNVSPCLQLIKRRYLQENKIRFFEGIIYEDNIFSFEVLTKAQRVFVIRDEFFVRNVRSDSTVTSKKSYKHYEGLLVVVSVLLKYLETYSGNKKDFSYTLNRQVNGYLSQLAKIYIELGSYDHIYIWQLRNRYKLINDILVSSVVNANSVRLDNEKLKNLNIIANEEINKLTDKKSNRSINNIEKKYLDKSSSELSKCKKELAEVKSGYSFRIGRIITYMPRKIRGGIRCYKEHGLKFTLKRLVQKIKNRL